MKEIKIYNTLLCSVMSESNDYNEDVRMYAEELAEALRKEDTDLALYADGYHGETFYKKLHSTKITTEWHDNTLYGLCTATVEDDWTDSDTAELKEYLSSQYADGWGEGFEQREITSFTEWETSEEYDEEADEYYESEWQVRYDVYVSFWQSENFRIMTEAELKA